MIEVDEKYLTVRFERFGLPEYELFLRTKLIPETTVEFDPDRETYAVRAPSRFAHMLGMETPASSVPDIAIPDYMFDYQGDIAQEAFDKKRYAGWLDCGLGKTAIFLEWCRKVWNRTRQPVVIFSPPDIIPQTIEQCQQFYGDTMELEWLHTRTSLEQFCRGELPGVGGNGKPVIGIVNYHKMIPGVLNDLRLCGGVALDEGSILKTGGGKIKWNLVRSCKGVEYKTTWTATPAPNETMEYASQAAFLEKLRNEGEILWTFFRRDKHGNWQVKAHAKEAFFKFMSDWSIYLRSPARYGWKDNTAPLPEPIVIESKVAATEWQLAEMRDALGCDPENMFGARLGVTQRAKLNQLAKGFIYVNDGKKGKNRVKLVPSNKPAHTAKLVLEEIAAGRQVLVWTVFDAESEILAEEIARQASVTLSGLEGSSEDTQGSSRTRNPGLLSATPSGLGWLASLHGDSDDEARAAILKRFRAGEVRCLISKASLLGMGMNFPFVSAMVFNGWNDSYEAWYQAIRRAYRYGQTERLRIFIPHIPELEGHIYENILRKQGQFEQDTAIQEENYIKARSYQTGAKGTA